MHRLSSKAEEYQEGEVVLLQQPEAPVLFMSSASTDISTISSALLLEDNFKWQGRIRALCINELSHKAQIDHYLNTSANNTKLIIIRLLGGTNHWPYGLEQIKEWKEKDEKRKLIVISGTDDNENELSKYSSENLEIVRFLSLLLREGGIKNISILLLILDSLLIGKKIDLDSFKLNKFETIKKWDWKNEKGYKVGILFYSALFKANDISFAENLVDIVRKKGMSPKVLVVSTLRNRDIQDKIIKFYKEECIDAIITTTSFSIANDNEINITEKIWDIINVPVFQLLISTDSRKKWEKSSLGLSPLDLTMQVVMPEIDGRITTRPSAFKEKDKLNQYLATSIKTLKAEKPLINWSIDHIKNWINLKNCNNFNKKITILLANYPIKNSRLANGVGLDTPESLFKLLYLLKDKGYDLGKDSLPLNSKELINTILAGRTNDPESLYKDPLTYIELKDYIKYWNTIDLKAKKLITKRWNEPEESIELEDNKFAIHGLIYGKVAILIQPSRGYNSNDLKDIHSPDLPPPHRYIAQYLWIENFFKSSAIIHLGKHGSVEWLPGKGIGLSESCFPHISLPNLPNIYPFIVNDPGEGSQAKRRTQALIIDHLTPPLGRSGLYGNMSQLESLLEEYYNSKILLSKRTKILKERILNIFEQEDYLFSHSFADLKKINDLEFQDLIDKADSFLCEIKESQIRIGLHILGQIPNKNNLIQLVTSIARSPQNNYKGITQLIAEELNFRFDPWSEEEKTKPNIDDSNLFKNITGKVPRNYGQIVDYIEQQANIIISKIIGTNICNHSEKDLHPKLISFSHKEIKGSYAYFINNKIVQKIYESAKNENLSLINSLNGNRIESGPSGAPTRSRLEVLPTGRNFYSVDIRGLPTQAAWDLGKRSSQQIIEIYNLENGEELRNIAISIWATSTMRNGGEDIAQVLSLMGIQPIWEYSTSRLIDLEVIPLSVLGRPRVDVLTRVSGLFRDSFPQLIELLHSAQLKLAGLKEDKKMNPYTKLTVDGFITKRIFGSAPGSYGAGLQELISSSNWENKSELVESYLCWSKWSYSSGDKHEENLDSLKCSLGQVQVVLQNQDNREHDILDSDDYYQFHGGLSASVEECSGKKPMTLIADHSRYSRPRVKSLNEEIDRVVRSRLLNPKWINAMKSHGYKGAFEIGASIDYLFGYDATTNSVTDWTYKEIYETYLNNKINKDFIASSNPWVLRDIAERLLEASNRGLWERTDQNIINHIKIIINSSESIIENHKV